MKSKRINPIINYWKFNGLKHKISFYDGSKTKSFIPSSQSYGICFTESGKIVIGRHPGAYNDWILPGGQIEPGESPKAALIRELDEELSLKPIKIKLLGAQKVEYLNINKRFHFQLRYFVLVQLKKLTPDPDNGHIWKRKLITVKEFQKYIKWGTIGEHMLNIAYKEFLKSRGAL